MSAENSREESQRGSGKLASAGRRFRRLRNLQILKRILQAIGLASLILVMNYGEMLGGGRDVRLHVPYRLTGIALAQIADILILGLVLFAIAAPLQRTRFFPWVRMVLAVAIPPYLFARNRSLFPFGGVEGILAIIAVVWAAFVLLLLMVFPVWYRRLIRLGDTLGIFIAVFALTSIVQLLYVIRWRPQPPQYHAAWNQPDPEPSDHSAIVVQLEAPPVPRTHPLIVWLILDELSYDQLFEHRARDLELPGFDQLRSISTLFTDTQPIGLKTVKIIPSLLTGHTVDDFHFSFDNRFSIHYAGVHGWHPLTGSGTLFADARAAGYRTAAVGWYNPYCTIYRNALDDCYWMNLDKIDGPMAQRKSFWLNMFTPLQQLVREVRSPSRADRDLCSYDVRQRLQTHRDLNQHAFALLDQDQADFVFLHFAVPHSPNIWSRADANYTEWCDSSYIDSLALADRIVQRLLATLKASPRWRDTTLIVQGDHAWRIKLWDWTPTWTDEDDHASRGTFDTRPALLIHQAGQSKPQTVATPYPLIQVHDIIDNILRNQPVPY